MKQDAVVDTANAFSSSFVRLNFWDDLAKTKYTLLHYLQGNAAKLVLQKPGKYIVESNEILAIEGSIVRTAMKEENRVVSLKSQKQHTTRL